MGSGWALRVALGRSVLLHTACHVCGFNEVGKRLYQ